MQPVRMTWSHPAGFGRTAVRSALLAMLALTGGACARVQPHLHLPTVTIDQPEFRATVVGYTGSAIVSGNRVDLLFNGQDIFPAKLAAIRGAKTSINYAQYVFEEGDNAAAVAEALAERCRAGVTVNVLLDAFGSLLMPSPYRQTLDDAGCRVASYRPLKPFALDRYNFRNHRRILVVDGRIGVTGGSGTSGKWSGDGRQKGHWRDTDVRVEGPVVEQLQGAFAENWLEATGFALGGKTYFPQPAVARGAIAAQAVRSSPAGGSAAMYTMYLLAMSAARSTIHITNPYFVPEQKMIDTLVDAAERGVRVVILMPGVIDHNIVRQASRSELGKLLKVGVQIYEYQPALLHSKTMVVDGKWATVGSTNLDHRSFALNEELNLVVYDEAIAGQFARAFQEDLRFSTRLTYEAWKNRGLASRLLEFLSLPIKDQL
jgi:cardiolipin synthase A/B